MNAGTAVFGTFLFSYSFFLLQYIGERNENRSWYINIRTVSYTHLDVYKRQDKDSVKSELAQALEGLIENGALPEAAFPSL